MPITTHLNLVDSSRRRDSKPVADHSNLQPSPALRRLTPDQSHALYAQARRLQAKAIRKLAASIGRGIAKGTRRLATAAASSLLAVGEALAARRAYEVLSRLSDHQLADIGLRRDEIPAVAWRQSRRFKAQATPAEVSEGSLEQEAREAA